ncbi:MAG: hypothetical protein NTW67_05710 [Candidatus Woesearchaeota archaeon]|nr:hypothetical protein [Candidatus Woesearchaeota archaeon]
MQRDPGEAFNRAVQAQLYQNNPQGRQAFHSDLHAPLRLVRPDGAPAHYIPFAQPTPRQYELVELARQHYEPLADNRSSKKLWGVGLALAGAGLALTLMIGNVKPSDNFVKQRQNNYQSANERHRYFTGRDAPWYNSSKTLEDNLEDVKTDAQKDRKGGKGLFYFLGGLGLLAGLYGLVGYKIRKNTAAQAAQQAAQAAATQAAAPAPAIPAPAPAIPAPVNPAPAPAAPVPPNPNPNAPAPVININYYNTPPPNP